MLAGIGRRRWSELGVSRVELGSLGAERGRSLRGNGEGEWALKRTRSLSGITAALLQIYARHQRQETAGVVVARTKVSWRVGSGSQRGSER